jgi:hypothetical protein
MADAVAFSLHRPRLLQGFASCLDSRRITFYRMNLIKHFRYSCSLHHSDNVNLFI